MMPPRAPGRYRPSPRRWPAKRAASRSWS